MFEQHGSFWVGKDKDIIIFEASGMWNLEASSLCIEKLKILVDTYEGKEFGMLIESSQLEGFTPECLDVWFSAINYWFSREHKALVRVDDSNSAHYKIFLTAFDDVFRQTMKFAYSNTVTEGIRWLHSNGFKGFENGKNGIKGYHS